MQDDFTCGFIGLGLIGGSIARAMRLHHPACRMMAYDINKDALELAAREGVIDLPLSSISKSLVTVIISFCALRYPKMTIIWYN